MIVFASIAFIARSLGPEQYGYYTIIFVYLSFAAVLIDLGLQTIAVRESSRDEENAGIVAGSLFWLKVILASFVLCASSLLFFFLNFNETTKVGFVIAAVGFFFLALSAVPNTIFQSRLKLHYSVFSEIIAQGAFLGLVAAIFFLSPYRKESFYFYLISTVISAILTFLVGLLFSSRLVRIKWHPDLAAVKSLVTGTLPLTIVILLSQIHFKGDSILLSLLRPGRDVGIYNLAYKFFETSLVFPAILMNAVFPLLSRCHSEDAEMNRIAGKSFVILAVGGFLTSFVIYLFSPQLISLLGGSKFMEAVLPLKILGLAVIFSFMNSIFAYIVIAKNRQRDILFVSISGVCLNLILNIIFIPLYSYNACAVITVISECYGMIFMGYLSYKASGFNPFLLPHLRKLGI